MTDRAPRIIAFAGSLRAGSYNKRLILNMVEGARQAGAEVRLLDLADYPVPTYNADIYDSESADPHALLDRGEAIGPPHREPMPEGLLRIKEQFRWADGVLIATPEYMRTFPGALHNLLDWMTRLAPGESVSENFIDKVVGIGCACLDGGGVSSMRDLQRHLIGLGFFVVPVGLPVHVTTMEEVFDADGRLRNDYQRADAEMTGKRVADVCRALAGTPVSTFQPIVPQAADTSVE